MNTFSALPPWLLLLMLGAVSAGALSNLWVWLQRRSDTLHLWTAGWCAITGLYLISHYVQLTSEVLGLVVLASARLIRQLHARGIRATFDLLGLPPRCPTARWQAGHRLLECVALVERLGAGDRAVGALLSLSRRRVPALWQSNGRERHCGPADGLAALAEPIVEHIYAPPHRLAVVGSDPFALAIAGLGSRIGWDTTLLAPFGPSAPLPLAARCDRRPAREALADLKPDRWTAIAVVTHDIDADEEILVPALRSAAGYVGVLGSRRKLAERARRLRSAGLDDAQIGRLKAPIGLDLGAGTPWEVALSVAAEILESRRDVPISVRYERAVVDLLEAEQAR